MVAVVVAIIATSSHATLAHTDHEPDNNAMVLVIVFVIAGAMVLFAYVASRLMGADDPQDDDAGPFPIDLDED